MSKTIPRSRLDVAALAVHRVLKQRGFAHVFCGGYELQIMGSGRGTKDVDVAVRKPIMHGLEKVKKAFVDDPNFIVFDGHRPDVIRVIHTPSSVGADVLLQCVIHILFLAIIIHYLMCAEKSQRRLLHYLVTRTTFPSSPQPTSSLNESNAWPNA